MSAGSHIEPPAPDEAGPPAAGLSTDAGPAAAGASADVGPAEGGELSADGLPAAGRAGPGGRFPAGLPVTGAWQPGDPEGDRQFVTVTDGGPSRWSGAGA